MGDSGRSGRGTSRVQQPTEHTGVSSPPLRERQILGTWAGLLGGVTGGSSAETESQYKSSDFMAKNYSWLPPNQEPDSRWSPWPEDPAIWCEELGSDRKF